MNGEKIELEDNDKNKYFLSQGVLKLENGPEAGRINPTEILLGNDVNLMDLINQK